MSADRSRIDCLDGLRGFAALLVLFSHAGWNQMLWFVPGAGHLGVMLFFTLSGFLMAHLYMPGTFSPRYWGAFLIRRFFRIYPAFIAILLIGWLGHETLSLEVFKKFTAENIVMQFALLQLLFMHAWTIMVEFKFYFLFPLIACVLLALRKPPHVAGALFMVCAVLAIVSPHYDYKLVYLLPHLAYFIGGMLLAVLYKPTATQTQGHRWDALAAACIVLILLCILPQVSALFTGTTKHRASYLYYSAWLLSPLMVFTLYATMRANRVNRLFSSKPARFIGHISYSLYLINPFVYSLVGKNIPLPAYGKLALSLIIIFLIAWILYIAVEKPGIRLGRKLSEKLLAHP